MKQKSMTPARAIPILLLCLLCLIPTARADMGPKQEVTITVVNAPDGELYLDLLAEGEPAGDSAYFTPEDEAKYDPAILERLRSLEGDGWVLSYATGLAGNAPVFGDLRPQADGAWRFSYHGLRETFRVAAATADEAKAIETPYTREFFAHIIYDWETNTVRDATPSPLRFLARLASTLIPTLVVEGVVFWLFKFRERRSWLVFCAANLVTQLGLHLVLTTNVLIAGTHPMFYAMVFVPAELVIFLVEAIAYALLLREGDRRQRVGCAALSNVASALAGYLPLHLLYEFLKGL